MFGSFWILTTGFWILMILDCVQNERDRQLWIYILIFTNAPGALVYFIARWLPRANIPIPKYILLAEVLSKQGNNQEARICIEKMLTKLKGASYYYYKQNKHFVGKGEKLLKTLG